MKKRVVLSAGSGLAVFGVLIQFVPTERSNPPVTREIRWDSEETARLVRGACYDCHSNETRWPLYSRVAPVSWLIARDVNRGREHLNFSVWDRPSEHDDEIIEMVEEEEMPLRRYALLHAAARLTEAERAALVRGLVSTLSADPPIGEDHEPDHEH